MEDVDRLSDAAAASSAAFREERRTGHELDYAFGAVADAKDAALIETKILPALERYVAAIELAIKRAEVVQTYERDPKVEAQIDVRPRPRRRSRRGQFVGWPRSSTSPFLITQFS